MAVNMVLLAYMAILLQEMLDMTYKYGTLDEQISGTGGRKLVKEVEINDGIFLYVDGMEYPERGIAVMKDIWAIDIVKRFLLESVRLAPMFSPLIAIFVILPWKLKLKILNRLVEYYNNIAMKVMRSSIVADMYLTPVASEMNRLTGAFLINLGIDKEKSIVFAEIFANIINLDSGYRYRLEDLFNETSIERLQNPRVEIVRLLQLNREREREHKAIVYNKFKSFAKIISIVLLHPKVKRAFIKTINQADFTKLRPDHIDSFWMNVRTGYNFFGKTDAQRKLDISHLKVCVPDPV